MGAMEQLVLLEPGFCLMSVLPGWPLATGLDQEMTQGTERAVSPPPILPALQPWRAGLAAATARKSG